MRKPQLRGKKVGKNTYWYTEANGEAYFGKVGEVPYEDARRHFGDHIKKKQAPAQEDVLTVGGLFSSFLTWVKENRADVQYRAGGRNWSSSKPLANRTGDPGPQQHSRGAQPVNPHLEVFQVSATLLALVAAVIAGFSFANGSR